MGREKYGIITWNQMLITFDNEVILESYRTFFN